MAIDTARKRRGMLGFRNPMRRVLPLADGTIDADDRFTLLALYPGNLSGEPDTAPAVGSMARRRRFRLEELY